MQNTTYNEQLPESPIISKSYVGLMSVLLVFIFLCLCAGLLYYFTTAPRIPEDGVTLQVDRGMSVKEIADKAEAVGMVRSSFFLYSLLTFSYDPTTIYAGIYSITEPMSVFEVAEKLALNDIDATLLSITIPEGVTASDIAAIIQTKIPDFNTMAFLELTKGKEGYLFPDTYFVSPDFTTDDFVTLLTQTHAEKMIQFQESIAKSEFSEYEMLILASILEREAKDEVSMKMVSGILQNRLKEGMALQTDASIEYVLNKTLQELTPEDLEINTPYNTYLYNGLTPTPIGNPGIQAIEAVLEPTQTDYFYYITDDEGVFHYAKTFEEHKRNIARYLK